MSWLAKLFGGKQGPAGPDEADAAVIAKDLGKLNTVREHLGDEAISYVLAGQNDSVLLTLDQHKPACQKELNRRSWSSAGIWVDGRSDYMLAPATWRPAALRRYGEVLAVLRKGDAWPRLPGTDLSPLWFRIVVQEYGEALGEVSGASKPRAKDLPESARQPLTIAKLKEILAVEPSPGVLPILDLAFDRPDSWVSETLKRCSPEYMADFTDYIRADPATRIAEFKQLSAKSRAYGLRVLARFGFIDGIWFDLACEQALDTSKAVRESAVMMLKQSDAAPLIAYAEAHYATLKSTQKIELARALGNVGGDCLGLLERLAATETTASVKAELDRLVSQQSLSGGDAEGREDGPDGYAAIDGSWVEAPPSVELPADTPFPPELRPMLQAVLDAWRAEDEEFNRTKRGEKWFRERKLVPHKIVDQFYELVAPGGEALPKRDWDGGAASLLVTYGGYTRNTPTDKARAALATQPGITPWHLMRARMRLHYGTGGLSHAFRYSNDLATWLRGGLKAQGLRGYSDIAVKLGEAPDDIMREMLGESWGAFDIGEWSADDAWPYMARHFMMLDEAFGMAAPSSTKALDEVRALQALAMFPKTPARYFAALLERAIGDRKLIRQPARELLAASPGLNALIVPLLAHPKGEMRAGAAQWLGERGATEALPDLMAAARKEKQNTAKAALLSAISRLGGDISGFVSPDGLLKDAQAGLKKTAAKELDWFPFDALPPLKLKDGKGLDPEIARWWLVSACKLKQPGGNAWFDLLLDQLDGPSAQQFGNFVLQAWIGYDTVRPSEDEANAYAQANADATLKSWQRWRPESTYEQAFRQLRTIKLAEYFNSGNDSKGILALAARANGADAAAMVKSFFRDHYPRTAQCRGLIECLSGNPSPVATQFVLSIAKRWRTRTVQERAVELIQAIAERRGWTADQLADRTVPTGGFDDDGILTLSVGERAYTAKLTPDDKIQLYNADGKAVQNLPSAPAGEKNEALAEAKSALSTAKKEVKQVFEFQAKRLYEALCTERVWAYPEWSEYLLHHPLVGRLVQRLIWLGLDAEGKPVASFRPMEDLTLTDTADATVDPAGFSQIRLAHRTVLTGDQANAWHQHFKDYEIKPLFDQLSRPLLALGSDKTATEIKDREGWLIEAFKLRGLATKLGYTRGETGDGGWFHTYDKRFDALDMAAIVEFSGSPLPEENRIVAMVKLSFARIVKGGRIRTDKTVPLKEVPPVLLSEAWNDLHALAAAGTGFDKEWEKKAQW